MSYNGQFKGPTSSQKKRRGGKYRGNKTINVFDYDSESCNFGIIEGIVNGHNIKVRDLKTNNIVHCSIHRMNLKKFNKGFPVVFSYINGEKTGEVISMYNTDDLTDLCQHFKIGVEKASKAIGLGFGLNSNNTDDDIVHIVKQSQNTINVATSSTYGMLDLIEDNESEFESEEEVEVKYDRFGNTIEDKTVDIVVEQVDESNLNTIDVVTDEVTNKVTDEITDEETNEESQPQLNIDKFRKNKKNMKNAREKARNKKQSFIEY